MIRSGGETPTIGDRDRFEHSRTVGAWVGLVPGQRASAAELLQLKPSTLNEMMKRLGIHAKSNAIVEGEVAVE